MRLTPLTDPESFKTAYSALTESLTHPKPVTRTLGWQGGHADISVHWHEKFGFWVGFDFNPKESIYWCPFGTVDPAEHRTLNITFEPNMHIAGAKRNRSGVLLKDHLGDLYFAHTGRIGGGKKGVGRRLFLTYFGEPLETIEWSDGILSDIFVFGKIGAPSFYENIARYLRAIEAFKANANARVPEDIQNGNPGWEFNPEYSGVRQTYNLQGQVTAYVPHGSIVDALKTAINSLGKDAYNTGAIDLLVGHEGSITHLFEIKTEPSTTNIYQAVGQLMFHGALAKNQPRRILVIPGTLSTETKARLKNLDIDVLPYAWKAEQPVFKGLDAVLLRQPDRDR